TTHTDTFTDKDILNRPRLRHLTDLTLRNVEIQEIIDDKIIHEKGANHTFASMGPSVEIRLIFEFASPSRANYEIGPLLVRVRDPFGFYLTEKKLGPETFAVMPRPERIRGAQLRPRHVGPWPGVIPSKVLG